MRDYQSLQTTYAIVGHDSTIDLLAQLRMLDLPNGSVYMEKNGKYIDISNPYEDAFELAEGDFVEIYFVPEFEDEVQTMLSWLESPLPLAG